MFLSADTLALLMNSGLPQEKVLEIYRSLEADFRAVEPVECDAASRKRAYDRQYRREHPKTDDDNRTIRTSSLAKEIPPTPPKENNITPSETTIVVSSPKSRNATFPKSKRCPADWLPTAGDLAVGEGEGFNPGEIERELSKFRDHQFRDARTDWSAAFRNWLRNAKPYHGKQNATPPNAKLITRHENYRASHTGAEAAAERWRQQRGN